MKSELILCALFISANALTASTDCVCGELTQSADCTAGGCVWATVYGSSSCSALGCSIYNSQTLCDAVSGCAWTNAGACANFSACADYTVTDSNLCYAKDSTCIPGTTSGTSTTCKTGTTDCTTITDQTTCYGKISGSTSMCWWTNSCVSQDISKCSTITDSTLCEIFGCTYSIACAAPTCASVITQTYCTYVRADVLGSVQICNWANNACADAADTTALTASTCLTNTAGTYKWDGMACVACSGPDVMINDSHDSNDVITIVLSVTIPLTVFLSLLVFCLFRKYKKNKLQKQQKNTQLHQEIYSKIDQKNKQTNCSICFLMFIENQEVRIVKCKHIFHVPCLNIWTQQNQICPLCKEQL